MSFAAGSTIPLWRHAAFAAHLTLNRIMIFKKAISKSILAAAACFVAAAPAAAQDLLAKQAPIDKKMKAVDTLALKALMERESETMPASDIYTDWDNSITHKRATAPEEFRIDLRNFCMPTPSRVVTSNFGARWGRQHKGLDIKVYIGDSIRSAFDGKVRITKYEAGGYGYYVVVRHPNGLETIYAHLSKYLVKPNQIVRAGEVIGLGGNTGRSTGSHLHFETRLGGVAINPALLFDFRAQDVTGDFYTFRNSTYKRESAEATRARGVVGNGSYSPEDVNSGGVPGMGGNVAELESSGEKLYHKVKQGETLQSIAGKRGVSVETICRLNRISKTMRVKAGQILRYS